MGSKDIRIRKSEIVTKTQFLCSISQLLTKKYFSEKMVFSVGIVGILVSIIFFTLCSVFKVNNLYKRGRRGVKLIF